MKKNFQIEAKVWRWPGDAGWHFVNIDKDISKTIRDKYPKGFVRVIAKTGKTSWETSLFPHKLSQSYLLCITKVVRKKEDIWEGEVLKINLNLK